LMGERRDRIQGWKFKNKFVSNGREGGPNLRKGKRGPATWESISLPRDRTRGPKKGNALGSKTGGALQPEKVLFQKFG